MTNFYRLIQGDCLEVLPTLDGGGVDLVVTDPPYFLPAHSYVGTRKKGYVNRTLADTSILKWYFEKFFKEVDRVITSSGTYYVFCDAQSYPIFYQTLFPYCKYIRLLIWDKIISYNGYTWRHQHELIIWGEKEDAQRVPTGDGDVLKCRGVLQKDRLHPAEKPVKLIEKLIAKHACTIVLDPYVGSGSVMEACQNLKRNCIGIDLDESVCETTKQRCFGRKFLDREIECSFEVFR